MTESEDMMIDILRIIFGLGVLLIPFGILLMVVAFFQTLWNYFT